LKLPKFPKPLSSLQGLSPNGERKRKIVFGDLKTFSLFLYDY